VIAKPKAQSIYQVSLTALALAAFGVGEVVAQVEDTAPVEVTTPVNDSMSVSDGVSPGGAFLRAVLIPGWGHASIGARTRAGFYFALEATSAYGIVRTRNRISEARARAAFRETVLRAELASQGISEVDAIQQALDADATLEDLTALTGAREDQQEDWVALGIFLLFLSGADAYVSSHLNNFPTPIELEATPVGDGRMDIGIRIPVGR
jgi:hypothetical protein